jgi:hypothetical protein
VIAFASHRVIPANAGTHERGVARHFRLRCSWTPAFAGVTPVLLAPLLAACQQAEAPANNQMVVNFAPQKATPESEISAAERLVRARIAAGGEVHFLGVRRSASEGVPIVCGFYEQSGRRQRYVVVNGEDAFVEPLMRAGEMNRAVAEFCGEGRDNRPPPATPVPENSVWQVAPENGQ